MQPPSPKKFIPAGFVVWAQFYPGQPEFTKNKKATGARANGLRYEKKAQEYLRKQWQEREDRCAIPEGTLTELATSPWLVFKSGDRNSRDRFCQPDALIIDTEKKHITIVE